MKIKKVKKCKYCENDKKGGSPMILPYNVNEAKLYGAHLAHKK